MLMLLWLLRHKIGSFGGSAIMVTALKSTAASLPMALLVWYGCSLADWAQVGHKIEKGVVLGGSIICGGTAYVLLMKLFKSEEALEAVAMLRRKLRV
jgi:putative peptidoglycan lipid II flippase